jgi:hypothetical protein
MTVRPVRSITNRRTNGSLDRGRWQQLRAERDDLPLFQRPDVETFTGEPVAPAPGDSRALEAPIGRAVFSMELQNR